MGAEDNLLFAAAALRAGVIDPDRLADGCVACAARPGAALADVLVERGWLSPADRAGVEAGPGGDPGSGPPGTHVRVADDEVRRALAVLDETGLHGSFGGLSDDPAGPDPGSGSWPVPVRERYTRSRLHAQGGLGRVWLAWDPVLGREVAVKELRPEAADPRMAARFLREARITGRLEHPGIVPVYDLSDPGGGGPAFYTMRFVRGRTLAEAAREYHRKREEGAAGPLDRLALLNAFVAICQAVSYAHSRGVVHRDLKGQNVVLGEFGEVVVLDWGLAKVAGRPDDGADPAADLGPAGHDETAHGQVLGTPGYMAPEQAEGRPDLVGPATDVYGLGAVFYEILTGRPPFTGADTREVLRKVREEDPPRPRTLARDVPPALEAVCLRALAKRPGGRYPSADELARDIQRWLADEPVGVWRDPPWVRAGRWLRRHRRVATAMAVTVLTLGIPLLTLGMVVGGAAGFVWVVAAAEPRGPDHPGVAPVDVRYAGVEAQRRRAVELARGGDHADAAREADDLLAKAAGVDFLLYDMACAYALAADAAGRDGRLPPGDRRDLVERYGRRAVELLERAGAAGYFHVPGRLGHAQTGDRDLDPVRGRADFREWLGRAGAGRGDGR